MANRAFFRSSPLELTVARTLQTVGRIGPQASWSEPAAVKVGRSKAAASQRNAAPGRSPEPDAAAPAFGPRAPGTGAPRTSRSREVETSATPSSGRCPGLREQAAGAGGAWHEQTERELLQSLFAGDNGAWQEFDRRYSRLIRACIRRATAQFPAIGPDDAQEIEAMLWVQLLANDQRKLRGFEPERGCALSSWIGMLAMHCAYDYLRSMRREPARVALADAERLSSELPDPADLCAARERAARLEAALGCFSARDREFVRLYFGEGLEAEQVAGQMGISVKTVYSKKHKIRLRLESAMAEGRLAA